MEHVIKIKETSYHSETSDKGHSEKEDNKRQAESTLVHTLYRKSPLKEDYLSTKDKPVVPKALY